MKIRISI
jgi:hypothetical protein